MIIVQSNLYMNIDKATLKQLWLMKPWNKIENMFKHIPRCTVEKCATLSLDSQKWIEFTIDNFEHALQTTDADPGDVELGKV